jgi:hypothetical protein
MGLAPCDVARFPAAWKHAVDKNSRQSNMLEQILIGQVCNLAGICSALQ